MSKQALKRRGFMNFMSIIESLVRDLFVLMLGCRNKVVSNLYINNHKKEEETQVHKINNVFQSSSNTNDSNYLNKINKT